MEDDRLGKTLAITSLYPKTASAIPAHRFAHSADPSGRRVPPGGQLERPLSWLGRARLPAHLRVLTATTPAAVLSPPRATRIRSRTACNRRAAPLPSIVGAGIEDPCAICPEICGVTRLEPYVATRRGGGRLAEGSSSHISWCVHCTVWFLYLHRCRSRGPAVQGATGSGRTWQRRSVATPPFAVRAATCSLFLYAALVLSASAGAASTMRLCVTVGPRLRPCLTAAAGARTG